jgi:hypothetical protein
MRFAIRAAFCTASLVMSAFAADVYAKVTDTQKPPPDGVAMWRERPSTVLFPTGKKCQTSLLPPPRVCANGEEVIRAYEVEYEFNDAIYVAVLTWIPEERFRPASDGTPIVPADSDSAAVISIKKTMDGLAAKRQFSLAKTEKAKSEAKEKAQAEVEYKRKAEQDRIAAAQREQEEARQRFGNIKQTLVTTAHIAPGQALVWVSKDAAPATRGANTEAAQCFGWVNYRMRNYPAGTVQTTGIDSLLLDELGTPMLSNPTYNSAAGEWTVQVQSSQCAYGIPVRLKAPGTDQAKTELMALKPGVVFQLAGENLVVRTIQLFIADQARYTITPNATVPAKFDMSTALVFKTRNEQARAAAQQASQVAERARVAELSQHYWGRFVLAIKDTGSICQSIKQQMLMMHNQGVQDFQLNQTAAEYMHDEAIRLCVVR